MAFGRITSTEIKLANFVFAARHSVTVTKIKVAINWMKLKTNKNRPSYEIHGTEILLQIDQPRKLDLK